MKKNLLFTKVSYFMYDFLFGSRINILTDEQEIIKWLYQHNQDKDYPSNYEIIENIDYKQEYFDHFILGLFSSEASKLKDERDIFFKCSPFLVKIDGNLNLSSMQIKTIPFPIQSVNGQVKLPDNLIMHTLDQVIHKKLSF